MTTTTATRRRARNRAQSHDALELSWGEHLCHRCNTRRTDEPTITGEVTFMGDKVARRLHICRRCVNTMHDVAYMDEREG